MKELIPSQKKGFAIGHQDATSYGIYWKHDDSPDSIKSDVYYTSGKFPAVFGFDIGRIEHNNLYNLDSVPFNTMKQLMIDAYKKGGLITVSWHMDNPVSGKNSWDKTPAVAAILKEGEQHEKYLLWLERAAGFFKSLTIEGEPIPIIFRPFHEMNGSWFWWGKGNCTEDEYKKLWQETVSILRDDFNVHNLLYVYSPNKLNPDDNYLAFYPGDEYVDIFGIDIYDFKNAEDYIQSVNHDLKIVKQIATKKGKPYAFTETGLEALTTDKWFTKVLYPNIENTGISWVLFWRNYSTSHHYMPYKGHPIEEDFKTFESLPKTIFLEDLKN